MNTVQRIAKNTGIMLTSQVISYILGFLYMMYMARYLGVATFGILSVAIAFMRIFGTLSDFGLSTFMVREVARDKSLGAKYLANISLMKVILVSVTFGLIALTVNIMGYPARTITVVYVVALSVIFMGFTQMFYGFFRAFEKMKYQGIGQMLNAALIFGGVVLAIKYRFGVVVFALLYPFAGVIVLGYNLAIMRVRFPTPSSSSGTKALEFDWSFWKRTLKQSWPLAAAGIFGTIYFMIDRIMLSKMKGDEVAGQYSAAYNLISALSFIPSAFAISLLPVMSNYFKTSQSSLNKLYQYSVRYMYLLALPITIGAVLLSKRIILMIYDARYLPSARVLSILIWAELFIFVEVIMSYMLLSINKQKIILFTAGVGATLNVVLNFLLIPRMSYTGAALATVASDIYFFTSAAYFLSKYGYKLNFARIIPIPLAAAAIMGLFVFYFRQASFLILIPLSILIYFTILCVTKYISNEDKTLLWQALRMKRGDVD